jgi:Uma2 family endonuclease
MVQYNPSQYLPSSAELPSSDDTPVDNELQNLIPNLLLAILTLVWQEREDWFFGVDMGVYHTTGQNLRIPIVPDGFLSLGVVRRKGVNGRRSYVLWEENYVVPSLVLEVVSETYGGEYDEKQTKYAQLGVLYYVIYNPELWVRDRHDSFEVYRLVEENYVRQSGEPVWMPEICLAIGRGQGSYGGWTREWLYWYDQEGDRFPSPGERADQAKQRAEEAEQRAEQERQRAEQLVHRLRRMGVEPDTF